MSYWRFATVLLSVMLVLIVAVGFVVAISAWHSRESDDCCSDCRTVHQAVVDYMKLYNQIYWGVSPPWRKSGICINLDFLFAYHEDISTISQLDSRWAKHRIPRIKQEQKRKAEADAQLPGATRYHAWTVGWLAATRDKTWLFFMNHEAQKRHLRHDRNIGLLDLCSAEIWWISFEAFGPSVISCHLPSPYDFVSPIWVKLSYLR